MLNENNEFVMPGLSYWKVLRLMVVIFFLYLMGDAFYRWDGFRYYASLNEFLPSVALVSILWSIVAVLASIIIWLPLMTFDLICRRMGWKFDIENLILFTFLFIVLGLTVWESKHFVFGPVSSMQVKLITFFFIIILAISVTWVFRGKLGIIQERLTPLVWLFGIIVILSVPLVIYQTWIKGEKNITSQGKTQSISIDHKNRPNIIFVTFDALTARNMSLYGYHRPTTPFLAEWSKSASLFERVIASAGVTIPTTASLMTGKRVWTHQSYHSESSTPPIKSNIENLALELKKNGYYNLAFIVNPLAEVESLNIISSFDIAPFPSEFYIPSSLTGIIDITLFRLFGNKIKLYDWIIKEDFIFRYVTRKLSKDIFTTPYPPENAFNKFISIIEKHPYRPFFVWIHLYPPHFTYLPPEEFMGIFDSSSNLRSEKTQEHERSILNVPHRKEKHYTPPVNNYSSEEALALVNTFRARYDEFIRYCDNEFENFINRLTTKNLLQNTVVIVSSDHGEKIELNHIGHGGISEPEVHIPLIIKEPDQTDGKIINDLVEQVDITATILEIAKIAIPSWIEGRSLIPLIRGNRLPYKPVFSMDLQTNPSRGHQLTKGTIAVWEGDYKLIYYLEENRSLLFNLVEDLGETDNLFDKETETGHRLLSLIQNNLKQANVKINIVE